MSRQSKQSSYVYGSELNPVRHWLFDGDISETCSRDLISRLDCVCFLEGTSLWVVIYKHTVVFLVPEWWSSTTKTTNWPPCHCLRYEGFYLLSNRWRHPFFWLSNVLCIRLQYYNWSNRMWRNQKCNRKNFKFSSHYSLSLVSLLKIGAFVFLLITRQKEVYISKTPAIQGHSI